MADFIPSWNKILKGREFVSHVDNVVCNIRLSTMGIKSKGRPALTVYKNLFDASGVLRSFHITGRDKYGATYQLRDEETGVVIKFRGSYLTIAMPRHWTTYDQTRVTYNQILTTMVSNLLSLNFIKFGTGKSNYQTARHLLLTRGTIYIEHAIDLIEVKACPLVESDKKNKWYQRKGLSRLEVVLAFKYCDIKHALKQRNSLPLINEMGINDVVKRHTKNIMNKMPPWKIKEVFGVKPGKDRAYTVQRLKPVLREIITNHDISAFPAATQIKLHGYTHQNYI
ncbi:hypothetical protein [Desulfobacula sp.]|uniref:hypothetical protein n=1 Tax=Desulfobacula sp. TaxID=2593537 RepID=UPI002617DDBF|nr:hypothetical protein [Desulfobacula sp.]